MFPHEASVAGGKVGGRVATKIVYYCECCNIKIKGPTYFKHKKTKKHKLNARRYFAFNRFRDIMFANHNK